MIKKVQQKEVIEYIAVLWIIISSGFYVLNYEYNIPCMLIFLLIGLFFSISKKNISRENGIKLLFLLGFIVVDEFMTLVLYDFPFVSNNFIILLIRLFSLAFIMDNISCQNFVKKYVNIFVLVSLISLICFAIIQFSSIQLPFAKNYSDGFYGSFYFRVNEYTKAIATRNAGPYGEPGIFSVYIVFALVFHLFYTEPSEMTAGWNAVKMIILSVTLLTTLSGTGLLCFLIVFAVYIIVNLKEINVLRNPMIFLIVVVLIIGFIYAESTYGILEMKLINKGGSYGVRMDDTLKGYQIALEHCWFGTGICNDYSSAWTGMLLDNSRSNGLANFSAAVGIPFLVYYLINVFNRVKGYMKNRIIPTIAFFVVILIIYNTQPIVFQTIGLSFLFTWKGIEEEETV